MLIQCCMCQILVFRIIYLYLFLNICNTFVIFTDPNDIDIASDTERQTLKKTFVTEKNKNCSIMDEYAGSSDNEQCKA